MTATTVTVDYNSLKAVLNELWQLMDGKVSDEVREAYNDLRSMQNAAFRIDGGNYNPGA